ncbi:hypothetical protein BC835DRAFT_1347691 [Cytidiella melzeri]|nr:hypothetical protein BC835DRAFT_1347691 [Cytidiella melzeri]
MLHSRSHWRAHVLTRCQLFAVLLIHNIQALHHLRGFLRLLLVQRLCIQMPRSQLSSRVPVFKGRNSHISPRECVASSISSSQ